MIITSEKSIFSNAVSSVMRAASVKTTMPILRCILINADYETGITLTAYDNEMGIVTVITEKSSVVEEGKIAVEARIFSDIVKRIEDEGEIRLKTIDSLVEISSEGSDFKLQYMDADLFPNLPVVTDDYGIIVSQFRFKELITNTIFSISVNDSNKIMTGELLEVSGDELKATSLDGHRISIRRISLDKEYSPRKAIVPGKTLSEISKLLSDNDEDSVEICFETNNIIFRFNNTVMTSRLIEGEYFHIESMLSRDYDTLVKVNRKTLSDAMERASILIDVNDRKPLVMNIQDKVMNLRMHTRLGSFVSNVQINKDGPDLLIGFNPTFILDALKAIDEEEINLYLTSPKAPCFIRDDGSTYIYLILPINFNPETYEN